MEKTKYNYFNKFFGNYFIIIINLFLTEIIFKLVSGMTIFEWSTLRIFIGLNFISIITSLLISFFSKKVSKIISLILIFVTSFYTFLQVGFVNYLGAYISFGASSQLGAVKDYIAEFLASVSWTYYLILIPFITTLILMIIFRKRIILPICQKKPFIYSFLIADILIVLGSLFYFTLAIEFMQNPLQQVSNKELFEYPSVPNIAIKEFGPTTYCILDIKALFVKPTEEIEYIEPTKKEEKPETNYTRVIDDTAFEKTIAAETNKTYNSLNNYFINRDITDKNDYTGLFKDKNLIVVMMESVNDIIINEEYYPNFYKMYTAGWHFNNNYSPRNSCATGNNEMSGMTGLYSINDSCTANKYKTNTYYEALFNLFNNSGYTTTSMHDFTEGYYRRSIIHKNMGSSKYYGVQALKIPFVVEYGMWASDEDFMKKVVNIVSEYEEGTKFMTWLTTVSSHQPYSISSPYGDMYLSEFKNTSYNTTTKRYLSKLKVLDNSLGILLDGLEEKGLLDDTIIVMFADHYPYGLAKANINKILGYDISTDRLSDKTPLVIYNPSLESKSFDQYSSYMNLTPTIANLFDLNYDPRLYFGEDLFSKDYTSITVFADGSWKNEHAYYNSSTGSAIYYDDTYKVEDIKRISNDIAIQMKMSSLAIKNNYFSYLNKKLLANKVEKQIEVQDENQNDESLEDQNE